jgi:Flp pilus assembly protein TadD
VLLGESHSESHFNLGLIYERRGLLADAEREMLASLALNPRQPDARNMLGVIYAREGSTARARLLWSQLVRDVPDYGPARQNLALLGSKDHRVPGETAAAILPPRAAISPDHER